jgi:hypothetical protein
MNKKICCIILSAMLSACSSMNGDAKPTADRPRPEKEKNNCKRSPAPAYTEADVSSPMTKAG